MGKKILIVNWGTQSSDYAFSVAKDKKLEIYLATTEKYPSWVPGYVKKDNLIFTNPYDSEKLIIDVNVFLNSRKISLDAVTTFFEMNVIQTADLANALGLKFVRPEVARRSSANKLLMKHFCMLNKINTPEYSYFNDVIKGYRSLIKIGIPALIKPVRSGHSYGIRFIDKPGFENFQKNFDEAKSELGRNIDEWMEYYKEYRNDFLIEKYVEGKVFSVDGLVYKKKIFLAGVAEFEMSPLPYFIQESVMIPAGFDAKTLKRIKAFARNVIKKFGFDDCAFHSEYRLTNKGIMLLEIACRPPGGNMTMAYRNATGTDIIGLYLDICLGKKVLFPRKTITKVVMHKSVFTERSGEIADIKGLDVLATDKRLKLFWSAGKNDLVNSENSPSSLLYSEIKGRNTREVKELGKRIDNEIKFSIKKTLNYRLSKLLKKV